MCLFDCRGRSFRNQLMRTKQQMAVPVDCAERIPGCLMRVVSNMNKGLWREAPKLFGTFGQCGPTSMAMALRSHSSNIYFQMWLATMHIVTCTAHSCFTAVWLLRPRIDPCMFRLFVAFSLCEPHSVVTRVDAAPHRNDPRSPGHVRGRDYRGDARSVPVDPPGRRAHRARAYVIGAWHPGEAPDTCQKQGTCPRVAAPSLRTGDADLFRGRALLLTSQRAN